MKQIKNIRNFLLISLIAGGTWIGCDDANYSTLDTHVFFEEAFHKRAPFSRFTVFFHVFLNFSGVPYAAFSCDVVLPHFVR